MKLSAVPQSEIFADAPDSVASEGTVSALQPDGVKSGMILRIERGSIFDGAGLRTVVFLKGCPLRCQWCCTPESQSSAIEFAEGKTYGQEMSVEQLMAEVRKDSVFYFHSGGGLTISGGEPLLQVDFCVELLKQALYEGIGAAMETSLSAPFIQVEKVLPYLDILYVDLKHIDPDKHKIYTGADNVRILDNIRRVDVCGRSLIIRIPLIPGINDDIATLRGMGSFCAGLKNLQCVEFLPYHRLGMDTYRKLGRDYPLSSLRPPEDEHMDTCREVIRNFVRIVR